MSPKRKAVKNKRTRLQTLPDVELENLRARLNRKREYIAILELELFNTRAEFERFAEIYNARLAPLEDRLRHLRRLLYEALEAQQGSPPPNPRDFNLPEDGEFFYQTSGGKARARNGDEKPKNPKREEEIRRLFRALAKRFHPDLASDADEKKWREKIMTQVNQAYAARDLAALKALAQEPDRPEATARAAREQEITMIKEELKRLDGVIAEIKATIRQLEESPIMQLRYSMRVNRRNGHDPLTEIAAKLQEQIADLEEHLMVLGVEIQEVSAI